MNGNDIDKVYDLLAQLYTEVREGRKETNQRFEQVDRRLDNLEAGQRKLEITLEHDIKAKLQTLNERVDMNTAKLEEHTQRLDTIEKKLDALAMSVNSQDKRLEVVESARRKKAK